MLIDDRDSQQLQRTLALADEAIGRSDPNPRVGCVLADASGRVVGVGSTLQAGQAHAEVVALQQAHEAGAMFRGGTAWVSLEPCSHHGRTPPCCDALIAAGVRRVVVAVVDPNPVVAGQGVARLRAAGLQVDMADADFARRAIDVNIGFFSRMQRGRPWVRLKLAASLDGTTALGNGASQWITGEAARADGHAWRRRAGAVLTGVGTVLRDNPRLDVRHVTTAVQPLRVVIDSHLRAPVSARVFEPPGAALVYCAKADERAMQALQASGVEVQSRPGASGRVDLQAVLADLGTRGINELHVEGGASLAASLLSENLLDELLLYQAPRLLGPGKGLFAVPPLSELAQSWPLQWHSVERVGDDLRIVARRLGHDAFPS